MDLITIATFISLEVASGFLKEHGKDIYQRVKNLLTPEELISLDLLEKYPHSKELQGEVATALKTHLEADPDIAKELEALLAKLPAAATKQNTLTQTGDANISVQGSHNVVEQRIGQIANSITNIGYQPKQIPQHAIPEFLDLMKSVGSITVHITANILDPETHFLAKQLTDLLQKAGWDASGESLSSYDGLPKGLVFLVPQSMRDSLPLDILSKFLKAVGFTNYRIFTDASETTIVINAVG